MKHIFGVVAFALALAVLAPTLADACAVHKRKPTTCTSYTNITGTTRTTCR
jgi:hypothetical protein